MNFLKKYRKDVTELLTKQLSSLEDPIMTISGSVKEKLLPFSTSGKFIRASLVCGVHEWYEGNEKQKALEAAAAMELIQSCLLIIDDIIDKDTMRRGRPTIYKQFEEDVKDEHHARSLAMCLALVSNFQAMSLLKNQPPEVHDLTGHLLTWCGYGEMQEVVYTLNQKTTVEEVKAVYRNKTATYTFSLPMSIGGILAGADGEEVQKLHDLGEHLGLMFQIRDDFIDSLGPEVTGKSASDADNEVLTITELIGEEKTQEMINKHKKMAEDIIKTMKVQKPFLGMIEYILTRTK